MDAVRRDMHVCCHTQLTVAPVLFLFITKPQPQELLELADAQLRYSIETWTCQLQDFVSDVIQQPVYLAGNSLGGLLSAHLAATQAHLCKYSPSLS